MSKFILDPGLEPFATPRQWELLKAAEEHGSERAAAEALGLNKNSVNQAKKAVLDKAASKGYAPSYDYTKVVPDGFRLRGVSSYYGKDGELRGQWVKSERDRERQQEIFDAIIAGLSGQLEKAEPIAGPDPALLNDDLLACYPVGDLHLGMLSWGQETGADFDLKIGKRLMNQATDYLVGSAPPSQQALVVFLGDFLHYDSMIPVTPTAKNQLDSDSRPAKMIRAGVGCMRYAVEAAARKHGVVHVIAQPGNHDPFSTLFLIECLRNIYENDPRITVDDSPSHYHYFRFGKNLIGVTHGDTIKMQQLPLIMAADRPEDWGQTEHRTWWTGHIHHAKTQAAVSSHDFTGCTAESFAVLGPEDAWAHKKGYRAKRRQQSIILHREYGEFARHTVNPEMFG